MMGQFLISIFAVLIILGACNTRKASNGDKDSANIESTRRDADRFDAFGLNPTCKSSTLYQSLRSDPIQYNGKQGLFGFSVTATSRAYFQAQKGSLEVSSSFQKVQASIGAGQEADKALRKLSAKRLGFLLRQNWSQFYQAYGGRVACTVFPITSMTEKSEDGTESIVEFQPALPYLISPSESPEIYQKELSAGLNVSNITARIIKANDPEVVAGQTFVGSVSIQPAVASRYGATYAYKISINFGGKEAAMGLLSKATYYILNAQFAVVEVETGNAASPVVLYRKEL